MDTVMESLQGYFLLSTPKMSDPRFQEKLIYLCAHNNEGAMGLIVNEPTEDISFADILRSADIAVPDISFPPVYLGGPVELNAAFFLFSSDYSCKNQLSISKTVALSSDPQMLRDVAGGTRPLSYIFSLGYAGWGPGQLDFELTQNGWLTLPANDDVLFQTPDGNKWKKAAQLYGIDITTFENIVGNA
jgi:putative transcriptional regulator